MKTETKLYIATLIVMLLILCIPFMSAEYERYVFQKKVNNFVDIFTKDYNGGW